MIKRFRYSVQDQVYDTLRQDILNLNLVPGASISETEISLRFSVSRTPVREAFIHLAKEDLINILPQKGTFVSLIDFAQVEQEFFLRESLELAVLSPFLERCGGPCFETLEAIIEAQRKAIEQGDFVALVNYDDDFHRTFYEIAGQDLAWNVLTGRNGHYRRVRLLSTWFSGIAGDVVNQHRSILRALQEGSLEDARRELQGHLRKLEVEEAILRAEFPAFFGP
ncbi:MAG: GntR family transcriptional regulator [Treponema sp.]|jgi:DNA-binding GntR family transcriptional regulator|nr:GntR family transcriptional regulator [Treponema sp.]